MLMAKPGCKEKKKSGVWKHLSHIRQSREGGGIMCTFTKKIGAAVKIKILQTYIAQQNFRITSKLFCFFEGELLKR